MKFSRREVFIHYLKSHDFWFHFEWILHRIGMDFERLLASFSELYIGSVSKRYPRAIFGGFGPPIWKAKGGRGMDFCSCLGILLALGAVFGPNWPQEASKIPPRGLLEPILKDYGPNLVDFGSHFCGFGIDFSSDLHWFFTLDQMNQINQPINQSTYSPRHGGGQAAGNCIYFQLFFKKPDLHCKSNNFF